MNLNSIGSDNLRSTLVELFEGKCSGMNGLRYAHRLICISTFSLTWNFALFNFGMLQKIQEIYSFFQSNNKRCTLLEKFLQNM